MRVTDFIPRLILIFITFPVVPSPAQTGLSIPRPRLELEGETVRIEYNLEKSSPSDLFTVRLEIKDSSGNPVDARSLEGDIGKHISGGGSRTILWNLDRDEIFLDDELFFRVCAVPERPLMAEGNKDPESMEEDLHPPETGENQAEAGDPETGQADDLTEQPREGEPEESEKSAASVQQEWNRTGLVLQSLALPGLGLSRVQGKPHWIRGVAGYGCIAGSVILNRKAAESYESYRSVSRLSDVDTYFREATNQDLASEILAWAAIGIWAADMVWTLAGTSGLNHSPATSRPGGLSVSTAVQSAIWKGNGTFANVTSLTIRYRF